MVPKNLNTKGHKVTQCLHVIALCIHVLYVIAFQERFIKILNLLIFHPILTHFFAKCSSLWVTYESVKKVGYFFMEKGAKFWNFEYMEGKHNVYFHLILMSILSLNWFNHDKGFQVVIQLNHDKGFQLVIQLISSISYGFWVKFYCSRTDVWGSPFRLTAVISFCAPQCPLFYSTFSFE